MTPFGIIRKFGSLIRGGAGTPQILLGAVLGTIIGMVPGFNMTVVLAVALLLLLNANAGLAVPGFLIGKALCHALAAVTFRIGYLIIHGMGMEGLFRAASQTPVVALMDLHYYCVTGGLAIGIVVGIALGIAAAVLIGKARAAIDAGAHYDRYMTRRPKIIMGILASAPRTPAPGPPENTEGVAPSRGVACPLFGRPRSLWVLRSRVAAVPRWQQTPTSYASLHAAPLEGGTHRGIGWRPRSDIRSRVVYTLNGWKQKTFIGRYRRA